MTVEIYAFENYDHSGNQTEIIKLSRIVAK